MCATMIRLLKPSATLADINDPTQTKYHPILQEMAKELESLGAHIIAIKDMAGLLKPQAAYRLISELKDTVNLPIHLHTHAVQAVARHLHILRSNQSWRRHRRCGASAAGGTTSQPSISSLYYAWKVLNTRRKSISITYTKSTVIGEDIRDYYEGFEGGIQTTSTEVYNHQMPVDNTRTCNNRRMQSA